MAELFTVTPADYQELALFLAGFHPETESQTFWLNNFHFWWDDNPAFENGFERGWLLRENGNIVGFLGSIPTCFQLGGQSMTVFNSTTWRVLPQARNQSVNLLMKLLNASKHSILFNTTPNQEVTQILKALKFQLIPGLADYRRSLLIVNFEKVLSSKLGNSPARKVLAKLLAPSLRLIQGFRLRKLNEAELIGVKQITTADASFDQLWLRTKDLYPNTNIRTAEIINWVCFKKQDLTKLSFGCYRDDQLLGYTIFETKLSKKHSLKILECVDLWLDPAESHLLQALVRAAKNYARQNSIDLISFPHFNNQIDIYFSRLGLLYMKSERNEYLKANPRLAQDLTAENSYFVGLQGDAGLA
jgi:hypothetical protein